MIKNKRPIYGKILALFLCLMMVGNVAFAAALTDVTASHWANDVVQNMVDKDIMAFYEDNSFKPDQQATKIETIIVIYNTALAAGVITEDQGDELASKYASQFENLGIPKTIAPYGEVVYAALGYALGNNILVMDEVKYFVNEGKATVVSKVEASVFFGKALNLYKNENLNKVITLTYKDASEITLVSWKYVNLLIEYNMISAKGDSDGNFNPKTILNRAVLAVFADGYDKALASGISEIEPTIPDAEETSTETENEESEVSTPTETIKTVEATITDLFNDLQFIEVKDSVGKTSTYNVKNSDIYSGTIPVSFSELKRDTSVVITLKGTTVTKVVMPQIFDVLEGKFNSLSDYIGDTDSFRSLRVLTSNGAMDFKRVYDDVQITLDGAQASVDDLELNFPMTVYYDGFEAKSIVAYSDNYTFMGRLRASIDTLAPTTIEVEKTDGTIFTAELGNGVKFTEDKSTLNKNDIVSIVLSYGEVSSVSYVGQVRDIVGNISGIYIKKTPEIEIHKADGTYETVALAETYKVVGLDDNTSGDVYSLRLDQMVSAHVGIGGVDKISVGNIVISQGLKAKITTVIASSNLLIVALEDGTSMTVAFANDASLSIGDYKVGNSILLDGTQLSEGLFEAEKITVIAE